MSVATALLILCARAGAEPSVVVLDSPESPPLTEFVSALELHLGGAAVVQLGPTLAGSAVADRLARAAAHAEAEGAALVLWIEAGPQLAGQRTVYVAYVVGRQPERALLEVIRVPSDEPAAAARVVALKVGSLIDLLLAAPPASELARGISAASGHVSPGSRVRWLTAAAEAMAAHRSGDDRPRAGLGLAGGLLLQGARWQIGAQISARWLSSTSRHNELGTVKVGETGAGLSARVAHAPGRLELAGELEIGMRLLHATGTAEDGATDTALVASPMASAALGVGLKLTPRLVLRAAAGLEHSPVRQRFLLLRQPAVDLGRNRPVARLTILWLFP